MIEDWRHGGFGLYIHWPFCAAKCPYCDFNSHVVRDIDQSVWAQAYEREIARVAAETEGRILNSVFFGGGTPSLMAPDTVTAVLEAVRSHWVFSNDVEITLEANPGSVEAGRFRGYADAGVNRISMGVQALNDADLKRLGRLHSVAEARAAFDIARSVFDRVSFDLIYARQDQGLAEWEAELTQALSMAVDHLSLYQLTVESGTAFGDRYKLGKLKGLPDEDLAADMYALTQDLCLASGFPGYEISNHARPGAESRHNLIYWTYGDYAGIGPGAHGRLTINGQRFATEAPLAPGAWLKSAKSGIGESERTALSNQEMAEEYLMMGLRVSNGLDIERLESLAGTSLNPSKVDELTDLGLVFLSNQRLRTTDKGRVLLNAIIGELAAAFDSPTSHDF